MIWVVTNALWSTYDASIGAYAQHVHPLQLDVIERCVVLRSNPGETILTPFMGVGSEVYGALVNGRRAIGIELKASYYRQAVKNCAMAGNGNRSEQIVFDVDEGLPID